ncbi:hypothetical protein B0H14DRAFT_2573732 [Mycena olivaceomarginata]|nr:hypothetical protein B0H14DRAFT_2573732 [Mycena olivaceomarginata]
MDQGNANGEGARWMWDATGVSACNRFTAQKWWSRTGAGGGYSCAMDAERDRRADRSVRGSTGRCGTGRRCQCTGDWRPRVGDAGRANTETGVRAGAARHGRGSPRKERGGRGAGWMGGESAAATRAQRGHSGEPNAERDGGWMRKRHGHGKEGRVDAECAGRRRRCRCAQTTNGGGGPTRCGRAAPGGRDAGGMGVWGEHSGGVDAGRVGTGGAEGASNAGGARKKRCCRGDVASRGVAAAWDGYVRGEGGRHGERTLRGACVHRKSQNRSRRAWARIGQRGDVARAQAEWAARAGYRKRVRASIEGGDGRTASAGVRWAALGVRSWLAGYSKRHRRDRGVTWHRCRRGGRRARGTEGITQGLALGAEALVDPMRDGAKAERGDGGFGRGGSGLQCRDEPVKPKSTWMLRTSSIGWASAEKIGGMSKGTKGSKGSGARYDVERVDVSVAHVRCGTLPRTQRAV